MKLVYHRISPKVLRQKKFENEIPTKVEKNSKIDILEIKLIKTAFLELNFKNLIYNFIST